MGRPILLPGIAQLLEQAWREQRVTILLSLALLDANQLSLGVNMVGLKMPNLLETQTGGISRHQEDAIASAAGGIEELNQFQVIVDFRKFARMLTAKLEIEVFLAEHAAVEESDPGRARDCRCCGLACVR